MKNIAVLMTCYNRKIKTLSCLDSLLVAYDIHSSQINMTVFLTDDSSTDGTKEAVEDRGYPFTVIMLSGTGQLYWNGGMIKSWNAALQSEDFDGFLLLNDDAVVLEVFWKELLNADEVSVREYGKRGIYVGSTYDSKTNKFTYGGFNFTNNLTLRDEYVLPDGKTYQLCQCAHGNITYVSKDVVDCLGIFCDKYIHGGTDHDYSYLAYKAGFPILVLPNYAGICENDHKEDGYADFLEMTLRERLDYLQSPFGFNLHNTLLFQKRCFPYRYPFVWITGYLKALFPKTYFRLYKRLRK